MLILFDHGTPRSIARWLNGHIVVEAYSVLLTGDNDEETVTMTIEITNPEVEAFINQHLRSGVFEDAEDVVWKALQSSALNAAESPKNAEPAKDMVELFAPLRGLNLDFEGDRGKDTGRDIHL
jgi:hypothetical protein